MSQTTTPSERDEDQPTTPHEVVEKHGRSRLEKLANQGNTTAQEVLNIVDQDEGDTDD